MNTHALPDEYQWDPQFEMGPETAAIAEQVWPPFLSQESDLPQPQLTFEIDEGEFHRRFPAWGLREKATGRLAAYLNAVFVNCDAEARELSDEGWQFAIEAGTRAARPNALCLVVANVHPEARNRGLAGRLLEKAKAEARAAGVSIVIAPVRPSQLHERPDLSFEEYVALRREDGQLADPWLRAHERAGAEKLNICRRSAVVTATIAKWTEWMGMEFPRTGSYLIPGGLAPLYVDLEANVGTYAEPNVWFRYRV